MLQKKKNMKAKLLKASGDGGINKKHKCKRLRRGNYAYRGYIIYCVGYYNPEHRVCWEACPKSNMLCADFHGFSLREVKIAIDCDLDK